MSPRARTKKPPVASRRKRLMHALYLAQPFLQFVALMAVLFVLGRCSPLSPSTDRSRNKTSSDGVVATHSTERGNNAANEEDVSSLLKDISSHEELPLLSQTEFASRILPNSLQAEKGSDLDGVKNLFRLRARGGLVKNARLLVLSLVPEQKEAFFRGGSLRIALADAVRLSPEVRKVYFGELHKIPRSDLSAKAYLVMSDDDMSSPEAVASIPVATKFQLGINPTDEKAWLQVNRPEQRLDDQQQKLIESTKAKSISLVLVLE